MSSGSRRAPISLQFIVVGGSIAGLACAYALQEAGHQVLVLEKNNGSTMGSNVICSPPNMTRILHEWGLGPRLASVAMKRSGMAFTLGDTGEKIGTVVFHDQVMKALAADFLVFPHADLFISISELAVRAGANIRFSSEVVHVSVDAQQASAVLSTGEVFSADVVIGADGLTSLVRQYVTEQFREDAADAPSRLFMAESTTIDAQAMAEDDDLRTLLDSTDLTIWMGDGRSMWGCPSDNYKKYAIGFAWPNHVKYAFDQTYDHHYPVKDIDINLDRAEPRLRKLIRLIDTICPTTWVVRNPLESLVHESGRLLLVGAAAHPIPPNGGHNTAVGIEDAATLGNLFSRIRSREHVPNLVSAFDELRQPRSVDVVLSERGKMETITMPNGEMQVLRDSSMRAAQAQAMLDWDNADEEILRRQWEEFVRMFNYNAIEVVDDWWVTWGSLMDRTLDEKHRSRRASTLEVSVSYVSGSEPL